MKKCENPLCDNIDYIENFYGNKKKYCSRKCSFIGASLLSREKAKQTWIRIHGVTHPMYLQETKEKMKETNLKIRGVENPSQSPEIQEKTKKTMLERHGVEYIFQSEEFKEKAKNTMLERHGVENPFQSEEFKEKAKNTMLERHGVEHALMSDIFKEKAKNTMLERHGVEHSMQLKKCKNKAKKTMLERHGAEHPMHVDEFKEKAKKTTLERHGVEYSFMSDIIKAKAKKTMLERHGAEHPMHVDEFKEKLKQTNICRHGTTSWSNKHISLDLQSKLNDSIWLKTENETKTLNEMANKLNINSLIVSRRFKKYNIPVKHHAKSFFEKQVFEFVQSIYQNIIQNDRKKIKPLELDIWFPYLNLAIECNGRYFHQDENREQNKIDKCKEKGIDLHFIWDDEWYADQEKWKQYIINIIQQKSPN